MRRLVLAAVVIIGMVGLAAYAESSPPDAGTISIDWRTANVQPDPGQLVIQGAPVAKLWPNNVLELGIGTHAIWGSCWVSINTKSGDARILGEDRGPCIAAFDRAVRLARAEERVNRRRR